MFISIRTIMVTAAAAMALLLAGCQSAPTMDGMVSAIKSPFSSSGDTAQKPSTPPIERKYLKVPRHPQWTQAQRRKAERCVTRINTNRLANAKSDREDTVWLYELGTSRDASMQVQKTKLGIGAGGTAVAQLFARVTPYAAIGGTASRHAGIRSGINLELSQQQGLQEIHSCVMGYGQ